MFVSPTVARFRQALPVSHREHDGEQGFPALVTNVTRRFLPRSGLSHSRGCFPCALCGEWLSVTHKSLLAVNASPTLSPTFVGDRLSFTSGARFSVELSVFKVLLLCSQQGCSLCLGCPPLFEHLPEAVQQGGLSPPYLREACRSGLTRPTCSLYHRLTRLSIANLKISQVFFQVAAGGQRKPMSQQRTR